MHMARIAAVIAGVYSLCSASAQQAPQTVRLSLREALQQAVAHNPLLQASADSVDAAEALVTQAGLRPNPRIVVQSENARAWERPPGFSFFRDTDTYIYAGQIIERGNKRESRVLAASAGVARAETDREVARWQVQARVAAAYWNAAAAAEIAALYREDVKNLDQVVEFNRVRVSEGAGAGVDLMRAQIERERLRMTEQSAEQESQAARIALLKEMGRAEFPAVLLTDSLEQIPAPDILPVEEVLRRRPDVRAAIAAVHQMESNVGLQQAYGKTDPEVQLGYKRTAGFDSVYAAVSIPIGIHNRNQGNILAAEAEVRNARHILEALANQVRAEYQERKETYLSRKTIFEQTVAPLRRRSSGVSRISLAAYREGGVELLRVLDSERMRIEADVLYFRSLAELQQSAITLRIAEGDQL